MINGILNVYKERDYTSNDVIAILRGILKQKKIGHTGTLDPQAEGVLPVCLGKGTKLCDMLTDSRKEYRVSFCLGMETDTEDIWGTIKKRTPVPPLTNQQIIHTIQWFQGGYDQIPPMYSAKKINGVRMYQLARKGIEIERKPVFVKIFEISEIEIHVPYISMTVLCGKGTYIRTLCSDIGKRLQTTAVMTRLIRTKASGFHVENSLTISQIKKCIEKNSLEEYIISLEYPFLHLPKLKVQESYAKVLMNGNPLSIDAFFEKPDVLPKQQRVYDADDHFIGIYSWREDRAMFFPDKIFYEMS